MDKLEVAEVTPILVASEIGSSIFKFAFSYTDALTRSIKCVLT